MISQIAGWTGMIMLLTAYAAVEARRASPRDPRVLLLNLFGAIGIGISVYVQRAWPALALQGIWGFIALWALLQRRRT